MKFRSSVFVTALLLAGSTASAAEYEIDPAHSAANFSVKHLMISNVRGQFTNIKGMVKYDPANVAASSIEASIDANTVNTNLKKRDDHLRTDEFLNTAKHPLITFKSTKIEKAGEGNLKAHGDLTIHGVTKPVVLNIEGPSPESKDPWGNTKVGASATTKINRKDFGLHWNKALETGGVVVGDEVSIVIDIELTKKS
jgi:polyisoprenoid-binding protein YceI